MKKPIKKATAARKKRTTTNAQPKTKSAQTNEAYYHITATTNVPSILEHGLKGNRHPQYQGYAGKTPSIYALTRKDPWLTNHISLSQIWPLGGVDKYAVIKIDAAGITGKVTNDDVAEFTRSYHRIIEQAVIEPKYLKLEIVRTIPVEILQEITKAFNKRKLTSKEWKIANAFFSKLTLESQWWFEMVSCLANFE